MIRLFLDDPLFSGCPRPDLTGSPGLTDITFAGQRPFPADITGRGKSHWPTGISQREERGMGFINRLGAPPAYWCHVCMRTVPASEAQTHQHDAGADGPR